MYHACLMTSVGFPFRISRLLFRYGLLGQPGMKRNIKIISKWNRWPDMSGPQSKPLMSCGVCLCPELTLWWSLDISTF